MARRTIEQQGNNDPSRLAGQPLDEPTRELFGKLVGDYHGLLDENARLRKEHIDSLVTNASLREQIERLRKRLKAATTPPEEPLPAPKFYATIEQLPDPKYSPKLTAEEIEKNIKALTNEAPDNTETTSCIGGLIVDAHVEALQDSSDKDFFTQEEREFLKVLINQYHGLSLSKISKLTGLQKDKIIQLAETINEKFRDFQRIAKITIQNGIAIITLVTGNIFLLKPKPKS